MAKRKESPQKAAMREMMREYLKNNDKNPCIIQTRAEPENRLCLFATI